MKILTFGTSLNKIKHPSNYLFWLSSPLEITKIWNNLLVQKKWFIIELVNIFLSETQFESILMSEFLQDRIRVHFSVRLIEILFFAFIVRMHKIFSQTIALFTATQTTSSHWVGKEPRNFFGYCKKLQQKIFETF